MIEDRLAVIKFEQEEDTPCCKNCEHYYKPICMLWITSEGRSEVGENDWCDKWEKDN